MATGLAHHVAGEAAIRVGLGTSGALELLGYSVDGVEIEFDINVTPVYDDRFGPLVPADEQDHLASGRLNIELVFWDESIRVQMGQRLWNGTTEGVYPGSGRLYGAGGLYYRVCIDVPTVSPTNESPHDFRYCRLLNNWTYRKIGTKFEVLHTSFFWKGYIGQSTTTSGNVVYDRSNS